jgi:hypothetical protein
MLCNNQIVEAVAGAMLKNERTKPKPVQQKTIAGNVRRLYVELESCNAFKITCIIA